VADAVSERDDPRSRPPDPAGTRPKFDPETLRPSGDFRALPAGEPAAQAEGHSERLPEQRLGASAPDRPLAAAQAPHAPRFQFLLGALGALGVAGIAVAVSLALAPKAKPEAPWSSWKPSGDADPATQIAEHVAPQYTSSPGHLLVSVSGGPQEIAGQPVALFVRDSGSKPVQLEEQGVFYQMCGAGPNCSIPGKASLQRGLLVRREAVELALYTFHYIGGASQVVVTFPPPPPTSGKAAKQGGPSSSSASAASTALEGVSSSSSHIPTRVLLFRPEDLSAELTRPLDATLSQTVPTVGTVASAPEASLVDQLTGRLVYDSTLIPQSQSAPVLLLQQPSIGS
jgi:hypothetical protein